MSSLLQFNGDTSTRGVSLEFYQTTPNMEDVAGHGPLFANMPTSGVPVELVPCNICGKAHERLYVAWRKPAGMFGCWVQFRINGKVEVPDLSVPIATFRLPRDAKPLSDTENSRRWHRE